MRKALSKADTKGQFPELRQNLVCIIGVLIGLFVARITCEQEYECLGNSKPKHLVLQRGRPG